ncbi:hypothetical protein [Sinorhizobium sp. CCBAU 05631]|uniref:hypothetical protein n=1 Tax=Sinorhizobium sp. CCBAU 05631 TaxID=794846 RepID=UPI00055FE3D6|nr:hypothetical protein [Sinorhizobium sp. CCBAU 05631]
MSDLLQTSAFAAGTALLLFVFGVALLILPQSFLVDRLWKSELDRGVPGQYRKLAFGFICMMLAGLLYAFSILSEKRDGLALQGGDGADQPSAVYLEETPAGAESEAR